MIYLRIKFIFIILTLLFSSLELFSMTNEEIQNELTKADSSLLDYKCFTENSFNSCKEEFLKPKFVYFKNSYQIRKSTGDLSYLNQMLKTNEEKQIFEIVETCFEMDSSYYDERYNITAECLSLIDKFKQKNSGESIFFDYISKRNGIAYELWKEDADTIKNAILNIKGLWKEDAYTQKKSFPNLPTWMLLEYIETDARVILKSIGSDPDHMPGTLWYDYDNFKKTPIYKTYIANSEKLTQNFQEYIQLIDKIPSVDRNQIYERMRLMAPAEMTYSLEAYSKSNYGKYFMPNIKGRYTTSFKKKDTHFSISVVILPFTENAKMLKPHIYTALVSESDQNKYKYAHMFAQSFTIEDQALCKKTGTDLSTENVWSTTIKSKNTFYDVFTCEIPQKSQQLIYDLVNNSDQGSNKAIYSNLLNQPYQNNSDDVYSKWKYQTINHYTYNYYTNSELKAMQQNNTPFASSSSSPAKSTDISSSSSSSNLNARGSKRIESNGKNYSGAQSWVVICNDNSRRILAFHNDGHWHLNGSTLDMGSRYDSWSKEKLGDYICKEF